jgi:hypothetical protein
MTKVEVNWARALGELRADLGNALENGQALKPEEIIAQITRIIENLPRHERQIAKLASLIRWMKNAESIERVEELLTDALKQRLVVILDKHEAEEAKKDFEMHSLLVFIGRNVWALADWDNLAH